MNKEQKSLIRKFKKYNTCTSTMKFSTLDHESRRLKRIELVNEIFELLNQHFHEIHKYYYLYHKKGHLAFWNLSHEKAKQLLLDVEATVLERDPQNQFYGAKKIIQNAKKNLSEYISKKHSFLEIKWLVLQKATDCDVAHCIMEYL